MKVKLVAYTPNPELVCAAAAQTSVKEESLEKIFAETDLERARKLVRNVVGRGHVSIVEHASFTFAVEDVSRSLTHQLVRHRIASYTQQSQRYVKLNAASDWFVMPHTFKTVEQQDKFKQRMAEIAKWYEEAVADGIPAEDARFYLPNAAKTAITVTMNGRELLHFFALRCCNRAQWEIKELADMMLAEAKRVAPVIFENAGPNCVQTGYCPEGAKKPAECDVTAIRRAYKGE